MVLGGRGWIVTGGTSGAESAPLGGFWAAIYRVNTGAAVVRFGAAMVRFCAAVVRWGAAVVRLGAGQAHQRADAKNE